MSKNNDGGDEHQTEAANMPKRSDRESHLRSILKAFSWRIVATTTTGLIAFFILLPGAENSSQASQKAISIAAIEFVLKFFIYYLHERAWQLVPRGTVRSLYHKSS